jgi:DNA-binding winged helix-turn-helix (wHTH) protein/TolB-like protein/Tfp pilus assembly protein PilF
MPDGDPGRRRFCFGEFVLDVDRAALSRAGVDVKLRPQSFEVLRHLVERSGRLVSRDELMETVWAGRVVTDGALTQCIADIRRALDDGGQQIVRTVARRGFVFEAAVECEAAGPPAPPPGAPVHRPATRPSVSTPTFTVLGAALLALALGWLVLGPRGEQAGLDAPGPSPRSAASDAAATSPADATRIALLRFQDLSPDGDHGHVADGVAEEILHLLTQSPRLRVMAQRSGSASAPAVAALAQRFGAAYLLDGSVRRDRDRLRIVVRLVDAASSAHVWSRTYERTFGEMLALQRDIAIDVAQALKVGLTPVATAGAPRSAEAHGLYLRGRHLFHRRGPGDLEAAEQHLRQAVAIDPGHARAWTTLAGVHHVRGSELGDPGYRLVEQAEALQRALQIEPNLGEAHVRLARFAMSAGDMSARHVLLARAIQLAPDDPLVIGTRVAEALRGNRIDEAVALSERSVEIDPLSALYRYNLALFLLAGGRYDDAVRELRWAEELSPASERYKLPLAQALLLLGRRDEALREGLAVAEGPDRDLIRVLLDEVPGGAEALRRLQEDSSARGRVRLAELAAHRGDLDAAWEHLDAALAQLGGAPVNDYRAREARAAVLISPFLRPLSDDPRWGRW